MPHASAALLCCTLKYLHLVFQTLNKDTSFYLVLLIKREKISLHEGNKKNFFTELSTTLANIFASGVYRISRWGCQYQSWRYQLLFWPIFHQNCTKEIRDEVDERPWHVLPPPHGSHGSPNVSCQCVLHKMNPDGRKSHQFLSNFWRGRI